MKLSVINRELIAGKRVFKAISPGVPAVFAAEATAAKNVLKAIGHGRALHAIYKGTPLADVVGARVANKVIGKATKPVRERVLTAHLDISIRSAPDLTHNSMEIRPSGPTPNELGTRNWVTKPGRHRMVIVFHLANRAGPHIDVHIGQLSVIYRIKPDLLEKLRYNNKGLLTEASRKLIIDHVKSEIANGSRVPQNLDHTLEDAREQWVNGKPDDTSYGAGPTRQVVSESDVDIYKAHEDGPIEFYAPVLNPHRAMYLYKLYPGTDKRAPILVWGNKAHHPPALLDRLHLKMIHPEEMDKMKAKADMSTSTAKYDGASCYVVTGPKGTTVWSPRLSSRTGEQIEYTFKLDGVGGIVSPETIIGMGELLFRETSMCGLRTRRHLSAAEVGGILNTQAVLPDRIKPEIRLYRIDKVGRRSVADLPFWENRKLQEQLAACDPEGRIQVAELMSPTKARSKGFEGVVAAPQDGSVNDGFKMKWWTDPNDWRIDEIAFKNGDRGGVAGVVTCTSLESGKTFKLGPGQLGTRELCEAMMADPKRYIGSVLKVNSRHGHEGRAAKVIGFHDDKGLSPF